MVDGGISEIRRVLLDMARESVEQETGARESLIAEIKGYQEELARLGIEPEKFDFENIPDSFLPAIHEEVWAQLQRRKMFLGGKEKKWKAPNI